MEKYCNLMLLILEMISTDVVERTVVWKLSEPQCVSQTSHMTTLALMLL